MAELDDLRILAPLLANYSFGVAVVYWQQILDTVGRRVTPCYLFVFPVVWFLIRNGLKYLLSVQVLHQTTWTSINGVALIQLTYYIDFILCVLIPVCLVEIDLVGQVRSHLGQLFELLAGLSLLGSWLHHGLIDIAKSKQIRLLVGVIVQWVLVRIYCLIVLQRVQLVWLLVTIEPR